MLNQILIWATIIGGLAALSYFLEKLLHLRKKWRRFMALHRPAPPPTDIVLENPEGQVPLNSSFYIERPPIETDCYDEIVKPNALIRIKAPRQMGKSSLMARIISQAEQDGARTLSLSFQQADGAIFANLDTFLRWFAITVTRKLKLPPENVTNHWMDFIGSKDNCTECFQNDLLAEINGPLVLALDEVDEIFKYPQVAADFFGLLRTWHEQGKNEVTWQRLRLVIVHSQEVYIPLDINQSPFNVGLPIELSTFTLNQMQELVQRHGLDWTLIQIENLMDMLGGHPYLVRMALYKIARKRITLKQFLLIAPTVEGPYFEHLHRHSLNLTEASTDLVSAMKQVVTAPGPIEIDENQAFKLRSMGLIKIQGNAVKPLCNLYRDYFRARL